MQSWPEEAMRKAVAVSIHGDEGTGKRSKSILTLSLSPLAIHRGDSMLQKFPYCVPGPVFLIPHIGSRSYKSLCMCASSYDMHAQCM